MAYIGKSPTGTGIRQRYYFTATGGETSLSGTDDNGLTMSYADGAYVDVNLNGIKLVSGTDYTTTTANTIGGLAALSANDIVEVVAYDIFTVADTVSAKNGGTFNGNVTTTGNISAVDGSFSGDTSITGDLTVDTDTLYVDSTNNRVGIGTTSPSGKLNLATGASTACELRLTSNNTGAGAGDRGRIAVYSSRNDGTAYEAGKIEIDRSSGTADEARMTFATNGGSGNTERMRIDSNGNLLVGTTTASGQITSESNGTKFQYASHNTDASGVSQLSFRFMRNTADVGSITTTASATAYNTSSDYRLKENVTAITSATDRLKQLNPVRFNFIADSDTTVDGFLAHEVQDVVPEAIAGTHNEVDDDGNAVYQGIDQSKLVPLLVATIQELEARISELEAN